MITDIANTEAYAAGGDAYRVPFRFDDPAWLIVTVHADAEDQTGTPLSYQNSPPEPAEGSATFTLITETSGPGGTPERHVKPTVALVPPQNMKVRFFAPETEVARYRIGQSIGFSCDGCPKGLKAKVSYVSPRPEFTPPVIYSRGARERLVFMVEAEPERPRDLAPGLPVDVERP